MRKHKLTNIILLLILFLMYSTPGFSQWDKANINVRFTVPEIAIVDIEPKINKLEFNLQPSSEAGGEPEMKQKNGESLWINYSSAVNVNTRTIKAEIAQGAIPNGLSLFLEASPPSVFGSKNQGISTGRTNITYEPKPIISGIGSCFTGDGINMGHELKYSLEITDFSKIQSIGSEEFTILYTITDN